MSYIQSSLANDEVLETTAHLHWILWVRAFASLFFLGIFVVGILWFVRDAIHLLTTEVAVTNRRLILKRGLFERHVSELLLASVEAVDLNQSFWGKIMGFGRLRVHGTGDDVWATPLIANPVQFRRALANAGDHTHAKAESV